VIQLFLFLRLVLVTIPALPLTFPNKLLLTSPVPINRNDFRILTNEFPRERFIEGPLDAMLELPPNLGLETQGPASPIKERFLLRLYFLIGDTLIGPGILPIRWPY
jgi:hypothetical protein